MFLFRADDEDDEYPGKFEDNLAMMDGEEAMDVDALLGDGPENQSTSQKWTRPDLPPINPRTNAIVFQQVDVDHYTGQPMSGMPGSQVSERFFKLATIFICDVCF